MAPFMRVERIECVAARFSIRHPSCIFELGIVELQAILARKAKGAVELRLGSRPLQQTFVHELFDVGEVAQRPEAENLQELLCRHIGEGRAGFGRAQSTVDEAIALQRSDDVAADLLAGKARICARVAG